MITLIFNFFSSECRCRLCDLFAGYLHGYVLQYGDWMGSLLFIRQYEIRAAMD